MKHDITPAMVRRAVRRAVAEGKDSARRYDSLDSYARRLRSKRDELQKELDQTIRDRDELRRRCDELTGERSDFVQQRNKALFEVDEARSRMIKLAVARDEAVREHDEAIREHAEAIRERDEAREERDDAREDAAHWLAQWEHARGALRGEP